MLTAKSPTRVLLSPRFTNLVFCVFAWKSGLSKSQGLGLFPTFPRRTDRKAKFSVNFGVLGGAGVRNWR